MPELSPETLFKTWQRMGAIADPSSSFTTPLPPEDEARFQQDVAGKFGGLIDFTPDLSPTSDYDYRGWWKARQAGDERAQTGINPNDKQLHFGDPWKTPYHHSFSRESIYATPKAGMWKDNKYLVDPQTGKVLFSEVPMADDTTNWEQPQLGPVAEDPFTAVIRKVIGGQPHQLMPDKPALQMTNPEFSIRPSPVSESPYRQPPGQPASPSGGGQTMNPYEALALQQLYGAQEPPKEKSWGDVGKGLMAPLAVGLLSSLVYPKYGGRAAGIGQGIQAGVQTYQLQQKQEAERRAAAQKANYQKAQVLAHLGQIASSEELRKATLEGTQEQRKAMQQQRDFMNAYHLDQAQKQDEYRQFQEKEAGRRDDRAAQAAHDRQIVQASTLEKNALEIENLTGKLRDKQKVESAGPQVVKALRDLNTTEGNLHASLIEQGKESVSTGLKYFDKAEGTLDKVAPGQYSVGAQPKALTTRQLLHPESALSDTAAEFKRAGLDPQAEAVADPRLRPLLGPNKVNPRELSAELTIANAGKTVDQLNSVIRGLVPGPHDEKQLDSFLKGEHEKGKFGVGKGAPLPPLEDFTGLEDPATLAKKVATNNEINRSWVKRFTDYLRYKGSYTEGMEMRMLKLLNTIGVARQQTMSAAMSQTGSRAWQAQMKTFGTHLPDYTDPIRTLLEKNETIADSYYRTLFQVGRWDMIPKDKFNQTKQNYLDSQGIEAAPGAPLSTAPASAFHD